MTEQRAAALAIVLAIPAAACIGWLVYYGLPALARIVAPLHGL